MRYSVAESTHDIYRVIQLRDEKAEVVASIAPEIGNNAFSLCARDEEFLWKPSETLQRLHERAALFGIPFLAPWANRIDQHAFWADGTHYPLNESIGNIREDPHHQPIHGLLLFEPWTVERLFADGDGATLISTFPFTSHPRLMAQFPFAHRIQMRHTVREGRFHVRTKLISECAEALPVAIGFHPYFTLPNTERDDWTVEIGAREHYELNERSIPTGRTRVLPSNYGVRLLDCVLDDVYADLSRGSDGAAHFSVNSGRRRLAVNFGPNYSVAVVYAPAGQKFVCIEPMAAITNAFNAAHSGLYQGLQYVGPYGTREEEFSVEPSRD
jgi:aldose 1-epimerase